MSPLLYPVRWLEAMLDRTTMYRVVLYALILLVGCGFVLGILQIVPQTPLEQFRSLLVTVSVALLVNILAARMWGVSANHESAVITALIMYFLLVPAFTWSGLWVIALATAVGVLSKYVIAWRGQHILNPAAVGAVALSLPGIFEATWWIATPALFVPLLIVGSAVVYKIRKWPMVLAFVAVGFAVFLFEEWRFGLNPLETWSVYWLSYPALFLAFFMLTEPFTTPPTRRLQIWYGATVGFLTSTAFFLPFFTMSPELALLMGNILFYPTTLRRKLFLTLTDKRLIAKDTYEYVFSKPVGFTFQAGQYAEWMLPHVSPDRRGVRRYFTIASSPTESVVRLALKQVANGSSYKKELAAMPLGQHIIASQLAGDFVLPSDPKQKIAAIAGGIGVTPFRSHIQYLVDTHRATPYTLFCCAEHYADLAYIDTFTVAASTIPCTVVPVLAQEERSLCEHGYVTKDMIVRHTPDYLERHWYLSGPPGMVQAYYVLLLSLGISRRHIHRDFFPGLA